jgi:2-polyprenyl-3-methyl-5-hydroxy-6-metoxy-1,4-benzoquinol methylase
MNAEARKYMDANKAMWDEYAAIHPGSAFYDLQGFKNGANKLNPLEREEVGDVRGKSLLHLQCHFGLDTLSWARLGASVTGVDFSPTAIRQAESLSAELHIPASFICCNLFDLPAHLHEQFDIVFTSYGVLCWLDDIQHWAQIAASYVKPGGCFYIAEFHPFALVFDDEASELRYRYPYFLKEPLSFEIKGTYADPAAQVKASTEYEWQHTLADIVTALVDAGLHIEFLHEHPFTVYQQLPMLQADGTGYWRFPQGAQPIPLMFSLKATKAGG